MSEYIIRPGESPVSPAGRHNDRLSVCELFADTVQGEGVYAGCPAVFLRLAGCSLKCTWCDTAGILGKSAQFGTGQLMEIFSGSGITERLSKGHHLVVTGGSPMLQQDVLLRFLLRLKEECGGGKPFIEIENECCIPVRSANSLLWDAVDCWNNSPKLGNSGIDRHRRYNPEAVGQMQAAKEAWFKFVVRDTDDWNEIEEDFISPGLIRREQVILMPEGQTRVQLSPRKKQAVLEMAVRHSVRYGGRIHIDIYGNRKGV